MANEITVTCQIGVYKPAVMPSPGVARAVNGILATMAGNYTQQGTFLANTAATLVPLGAVTAPGWAFFYNSDPANYVQLQVGAVGTPFARLLPGEAALFRIDPGATLYAVANTAAVVVDYLIVSQ